MQHGIGKVGYVGMGIMGSAMAGNLLKAGFHTVVWNRTPGKCDALAAQGAEVAGSLRELAQAGCEAVLLNVTDTADVEALLFEGEQALAELLPAGTIVVDHSTISPEATRRFAERLAGKGLMFLDAPVSGGDVGARQGTLSIMVGGDASAFERCRSLFEAMGKTITHLGEAGSGQVCKACNQVSVVLNLLGTCEALALANKSGLDMQKMIEVVGAGAGGSWQLSNLGPRIAAGDMDPGFMVDLVLKDLGIISQTGREQNLPLAGTALAESYFRSVAANGGGKLGTQAMSQTLERLCNVRFGE